MLVFLDEVKVGVSSVGFIYNGRHPSLQIPGYLLHHHDNNSFDCASEWIVSPWSCRGGFLLGEERAFCSLQVSVVTGLI